eukprot:6071442-Amphidinium_carterae.2
MGVSCLNLEEFVATALPTEEARRPSRKVKEGCVLHNSMQGSDGAAFTIKTTYRETMHAYDAALTDILP